MHCSSQSSHSSPLTLLLALPFSAAPFATFGRPLLPLHSSAKTFLTPNLTKTTLLPWPNVRYSSAIPTTPSSVYTLKSPAVTDEMPHFFVPYLPRSAALSCATSPLKVAIMQISQLSSPIILTMTTLRCLLLDCVPFLEYDLSSRYCPKFKFTFGITLTCLRSLSLGLSCTNLEHFNPLFSQLCCLEDLHLDMKLSFGFRIYSQTIKKLKMIISVGCYKNYNMVLSLPSLESLHLETQQQNVQILSCICGDVPLLRKAVINLDYIDWGDVSVVHELLNWISHVGELTLHAKERRDVVDPIHILMEAARHVPKFSNLKHLDVTLCFHNRNYEAIVRMLHNCPVLESLKLFHEKSRMRDAGSKLPRNADGNYQYAIFKNLHSEVDNKAFMKLMDYKKKYPFKYWRMGCTVWSRIARI